MRLEKTAQSSDPFSVSPSASEIETILSSAYPEDWKMCRVSEAVGGRFNSTYVVSIPNKGKVILRVAPSDECSTYLHEKLLLRREATTMSHLGALRDMVPGLLKVDFGRKLVSRDYILTSYIKGQIWNALDQCMSLPESQELWNCLRSVSNTLSPIEGRFFGFPEPLTQFANWSKAVESFVEMMTTDLAFFKLEVNGLSEFTCLVKKYRSILDEITSAKLVHGDLWPKNILVEKERSITITGVLDFERAFWGDPASEWIIANSLAEDYDCRADYVYRVGLFSADYARLPRAAVAEMAPNSIESTIRNDLYLGIYLLLRKLESQRYPRIESWIDRRMEELVLRLKNTR